MRERKRERGGGDRESKREKEREGERAVGKRESEIYSPVACSFKKLNSASSL